MDYKQLEQTISSYNKLVQIINSAMDNEIANNQVVNAPYEAFELMKTEDDNPNHLPYLYLRFVYLPYNVETTTTDESNKKSSSKSTKKSTRKTTTSKK